MMQQPAKAYPLTLSANQTFVLGAGGHYFKILSCTGPVHVIGDTFGELGVIEAGQGLRDVRFNWLQLSDASGADNEIRVLIAGASFVDDRVAGVVSVIDGGLTRTKIGDVYGGRLGVSAVAAQYSMAQFWNSSTTKNMVVSRITANAGNAGCLIGSGTIQLANLGVNTIRPKLSSGAGGSVFQGRYENAAALVPTTNADQVYNYQVLADQEPWIIKPATGLNIFALDLNTALVACVHLREDPIV